MARPEGASTRPAVSGELPAGNGRGRSSPEESEWGGLSPESVSENWVEMPLQRFRRQFPKRGIPGRTTASSCPAKPGKGTGAHSRFFRRPLRAGL